jgi:hypothetical protein
MKNKIFLVSFILFVTSPALAQKLTEQQQVQQVLRLVFEAFSEAVALPHMIVHKEYR